MRLACVITLVPRHIGRLQASQPVPPHDNALVPASPRRSKQRLGHPDSCAKSKSPVLIIGLSIKSFSAGHSPKFLAPSRI